MAFTVEVSQRIDPAFETRLLGWPIVVLETVPPLGKPDQRFERLPLARRCELIQNEPERVLAATIYDVRAKKVVPVNLDVIRAAIRSGKVQVRARTGDTKPRAYTPEFIRKHRSQFKET